MNIKPTYEELENRIKELELEVDKHEQAENALQESEAKFRTVLENSRDLFYQFNLQTGTYDYMSPSLEKLVGISVEDYIAGGIELAVSLLHPDDKVKMQDHIDHLLDKKLEDEIVPTLEYRFRHSKLGYRWFSDNRTVVYDKNKKAVGVVGNSRDITERKRIERDLKNSYKFVDSIIEQSPFPTWVSDIDGTLIRSNHALKKVLNLSDEQLIGKYNVFEDPQVEEQGIQHLFSDALENGKASDFAIFWSGEDTNDPNLKDSNKVYCEGTVFPIFDQEGTITNAIITYKDVSDKKRAEEELLEEKLFSDAAISSLPGIFYVFDVYGKFLRWNRNFETASGYSGDEIAQMSPEEFFPPEERNRVKDVILEIFKTGQSSIEANFLSKNGRTTTYFFTGSNFEINDKPCLVGMGMNMSKLKRAEEEKSELESRLQQAHKMEAIGTLAGGIAHDFNNILGAILGYAEMARDDSPSGSTVVKDLDQVLEAGARAKGLVKQILAFSRQGSAERIFLQPASLVKETIKMLRPSLPSTIQINQNIATNTGLILADPTQINQILMNICTNAFHAMEETGGKLDISLKETTLSSEDLVHEPDTKPGIYIQLSICDSGPGMTPETKERIFNPYFTTKETGKGTGMGLSIVHGIVKNYGGFISLYSELGEGSAFHVFIPIIDEDVLQENKTVEQLVGGKERVLFIDDEEILAEMGKDMLERLGYHVTVKNSSLEALETFQNQPEQFDIVITDQTMPGMTGSDLARRMMQIRPDIPIILCTGYSTLVSEEKAKEIGIKEFAMKPLAKKDIAKLVRQVLNGVV